MGKQPGSSCLTGATSSPRLNGRQCSQRWPLVRRRLQFVAKCHDERPALVFFKVTAGEKRSIDCSGGVQKGHAVDPAFLCMHVAVASAEAGPRGIRAWGCQNLCILDRCQHRPDRDHNYHYRVVSSVQQLMAMLDWSPPPKQAIPNAKLVAFLSELQNICPMGSFVGSATYLCTNPFLASND